MADMLEAQEKWWSMDTVKPNSKRDRRSWLLKFAVSRFLGSLLLFPLADKMQWEMKMNILVGAREAYQGGKVVILECWASVFATTVS